MHGMGLGCSHISLPPLTQYRSNTSISGRGLGTPQVPPLILYTGLPYFCRLPQKEQSASFYYPPYKEEKRKMTSAERKQKRYENRKRARAEKRKKYIEPYNSDENINKQNLLVCAKQVRKGVSWKYSVQLFRMHLCHNIMMLWDNFNKGMFDFPALKVFIINERGKQRVIKASSIGERVLQKNLCKNIIEPILTHYLIYDNGASLVGKGVDFARRRLRKHLAECYRKYGHDAWVLSMDFHHYFDEIDQNILLDMLDGYINAPKTMRLIKYFLRKFGQKGLGLGSQLSQILAIFYCNEIDHLVKDKFGCKWYGRYMDDSYIICHTKEELIEILKEIDKLCEKLHITINKKKTQMIKLKHGMKFLQCKYKISSTGKIYQNGGKASAVRERRKLKQLAVKFRKGTITSLKVRDTYQSWRGYMIHTYNNRGYVRSMDGLYNSLFIEPMEHRL